MTSTRLRECLETLHWSQRGLARILGRHPGTVRQWAVGTVVIPGPVEAWLEELTRHAARNPPPRREVVGRSAMG